MQGALFARCPQFPEVPVRSALVSSLEAMRTAYQSGDHVLKCRSWKVSRLTSRTFLWRQQRGPSKAELERRMELFNKKDVGVAVGGGEVQRHRFAKEACTVDGRGRFGP